MEARILNLKKYFDKTRAVDDISFGFSAGQVVGFVGPNGAGKTTTMRIIATLDDPTHGDVFLDGISVIQDPEKARRLVGYMPDSLPTHRDVTVDDYLDFFARAFGIRAPRRRAVIDQVEQFTNLIGIRDKFLKALSKGMKQRVSLARALIHDPAILILDEPAAGLDPRARIELRELLKALAEHGKAILVSSHILSELGEICDSVVIIEKGKLLHAGSIDAIAQSRPYRTILIRVKDAADALHARLLELPAVERIRPLKDAVEVDITGTDDDSGELMTQLVKDGFKILEIRCLKADLEDIFMDVTKGELN